MSMRLASIVLVATLIAQAPSHAAGPRIAPVPESQRSAEQKALAERFASSTIPNAVATYLNHPLLAEHILPFEHYVSSDSGLPPRDRSLLDPAHRVADTLRLSLGSSSGRGATGGRDDRRVEAHCRRPWRKQMGRVRRDVAPRSGRTARRFVRLRRDVAGVERALQHEPARGSRRHGRYAHDARRGVQFARPRDRAGASGTASDRDPASGGGNANERAPAGARARIPPLEPRDWTPEQRKRFDPNGTGQRAANVFVTFVRNPPADRLRGPINQHILNSTTLSVRQRETLLMRIGVLCRSEYEWAAHSRLGRRAGMTDADVARIVAGPESGGGDPLEVALIRATDELYRDDRVSDETWAALAKGLDTKQLLDVLIAVGGYRATSMAINSAGVQLDANMADFRFRRSM